MATNIPPHNLGEIIDACLALIDRPEVSAEELLEIVPGPDFPTGGEIIGRTGARLALLTGRGSVILRGVASVEARPQGSRGDHHLGHPLPGEQGGDDRAHRRSGAREADRRHRRPARRERPQGRARGDRAEARRQRRGGAEPALPLHAAADLVPGQRPGAQPRPARADGPQAHARGLHRVPRRGRRPAHQVRAHQGAGSRPHPGRPGHRRGQHRRRHRHHPQLRRIRPRRASA